MNRTREKKIVIIAGPNGAGKTTFAREFLPKEADCPEWHEVSPGTNGMKIRSQPRC